MAKGVAYYRGIRGSASLATAPLDPGAVPAEALAPGEMRRVPFAGELLGAARVRGAYAAIPLEALDRAGEALEAEEQAAYLHLLRLSYGEGRNWARAAKKELQGRLRLSERRLLRVLDALVAKGFARPLHRDNRGTLWRVALPREAFGEPVGDDVLLGRAAPAPVDAAPPDGHARKGRATQASARASTPTSAPGARGSAPSPSAPGGGEGRGEGATREHPGQPGGPAAEASPRASSRAAPQRGPREHELARALCQARGVEGDEAYAAALREVGELVEEGQSLQRVAAAIAAVARRRAATAERRS